MYCVMAQRSIFLYKISCHDEKEVSFYGTKVSGWKETHFYDTIGLFQETMKCLVWWKKFCVKMQASIIFMAQKMCYDTNVYNGARRQF